MPPRRPPRTPTLGPEDLLALSGALADGKRPTVYLRDGVPSLGVAPATPARVVAVDGDTVTVRPRGVTDDVPFEGAELAGSAAAAALPVVGARAARAPRPDRAAPARPRTRTEPRTEPRAEPGVTVTLVGSTQGWTVEVTRGAGRHRPSPVPAEAVGRAVQALADPATTEAVGSVLEHARQAAALEVEALAARLEQARATLHALS